MEGSMEKTSPSQSRRLLRCVTARDNKSERYYRIIENRGTIWIGNDIDDGGMLIKSHELYDLLDNMVINRCI